MKVAIIEGQRPSLMPEGPLVEQCILGDKVNIQWHGIIKPQNYNKVLADQDAVIVRPGTAFSREMIFTLNKAKVIVALGVGYDHICIEAAREKGIPVCHVPDYGTEEVADTAVSMILSLQRKVNDYPGMSTGDDLEWDWRNFQKIKRLNECHVGIIGLGRIGTAVTMRLKAFGCQIGFYDPYKPRGTGKSLGISVYDNLESLLKISDIISVHVPLNSETTGMIDEKFLGQLKDDVILVNCSRGGLYQNLDTGYDFLKTKPLARIGTDVLPQEPPAPHPLLKAWKNQEPWLKGRFLLTPHSAFYSEKAVYEIRAFAAEIVKKVFNGGKPYNLV